MGRPARSACALCGMGKRRAFIAGVCSDCGHPVCERHGVYAGPQLICKRCVRKNPAQAVLKVVR